MPIFGCLSLKMGDQMGDQMGNMLTCSLPLLGICRIQHHPNGQGPVIHPAFSIPYGSGAKSYLGHIAQVIWIWINLTLLLFIKYAPARGRHAFRQKRRSLRHHISAQNSRKFSLGSDEDDETWLRTTNKALMGDFGVFNTNHIFPLTGKPETFVPIPILPEFANERNGVCQNREASGEGEAENIGNLTIEAGDGGNVGGEGDAGDEETVGDDEQQGGVEVADAEEEPDV
ncbi:hypothetical protein K458DRAFT_398876 [Lentithecium fluviatile CBS 122367]|uniref:Uncharacterized protein n=1 Tax=Lentithecium fluviatile CBS 122367 TaxID=1168545 RepID=A0A6G1JK32_9PLEO|nr:hypothetical protein K458DRAFT_398876 [Lentithecium fluviatile CBS 122367]